MKIKKTNQIKETIKHKIYYSVKSIRCAVYLAFFLNVRLRFDKWDIMIHKTNKYIYKEIHLILLHTPLDNCKSVIRNIMLIKKKCIYILSHIYCRKNKYSILSFENRCFRLVFICKHFI